MAIARWSPIQELTTLHTTMDRLFGDMLESNTDPADAGLTTFRLPVDISETDKGYMIKAPIPGFKPEEVEVSMSDGVLTIRATHQEERTDKKRNYLRREVIYGNFERQIALPSDVRGENIKATFNDGVLTVEVPRAAKPQPMRIQVQGEQQGKQLTGQSRQSSGESKQTSGAEHSKQATHAGSNKG